MPKEALKLVLSFDTVSQSFKNSAYNLTADQAVGYAEQLRAVDGLDSTIIDQKTRHKRLAVKDCGQCKKAREYRGTESA